jgi:hypothetical protein
MTQLVRAALVASVAAWGLAGAAARADEPPALDNIGSSAYGIAAGFVADATATGLRPLPVAGGWHHGHGGRLDTLSETLGIAAAGQQIATLQVTASHLVTTAGHPLPTAPAPAAEWHAAPAPTAGGSIGSVQITLQLYPPPPSGPVPAPLLSVVASGVTWQASDSWTAPKTPVVAGSAGFTSLTITGSLVNGDTLTADGTKPANTTVLIPLSSGGSTRVTYNQQITGGHEACAPTCAFTAYGITVKALAIHLDGVTIGSQTVSGTITVGEANAHIRP